MHLSPAPTIETQFNHPRGRLSLHRYPLRPKETLQAWDGVDRYLLEQLALPNVSATAQANAVYIFNDHAGALSLALEHYQPITVGDSWLARESIRLNSEANQCTWSPAQWFWCDADWPPAKHTHPLIILRVPKELALLEYQLLRLAHLIPIDCVIQVAWLDKHRPARLREILERYIKTETVLAGKYKAHGLHGVLKSQALHQHLPATWLYPTQVLIEPFAWELRVHAGVFAQHQQDIGARFFMPHIPSQRQGTIADLGCGNGLLGMVALQQNPKASVTFCDESGLALRSARENVERYFPKREVYYHLGDGLHGLSTAFDLILLNPPFHRGYALDRQLAPLLFKQATQHLKQHGELLVVANSHLPYLPVLRQLFKQVNKLAQSAKFVVYSAKQPQGQ